MSYDGNNDMPRNFELLQCLIEDMNRRFTILEEAILRPPAPPQVPPPQLPPPQSPNPPAARRQPRYALSQYPDESESDDQGEYRLHRQDYQRRRHRRIQSPHQNGVQDDEWGSERSYGRYRNHNRDELANVRMTVPPFYVKNDPEAYLDWERKVDMIFDNRRCSEASKVKLASLEFYNYALVWWDKMVLNRRKNREPAIDT